MKTRTILLVLLLAVGLLGLVLAASAAAAPEVNITVNSTADTVIAGDNECTLREAINNANSDGDTTGGDCAAGSGDDVIDLPAGTYTLTIPGGDEDANATGDLDILSNITLQGAGAAATILDGNQLDRVLHIALDGAVVELNDLTVANGRIPGTALPPPSVFAHGGGGIFNAGGRLTLNNAIVRDNVLDSSSGGDGSGGGLLNVDGVVVLNNVTVRHNSVTTSTIVSAGSGLSSIAQGTDAELNVVQTEVISNAADYGGGILTLSQGAVTTTLVLSDTRVANNRAVAGVAGGILQDGSIDPGSFAVTSIYSSTIAHNLALSGGGMYVVGSDPGQSSVLIVDSTLQNNEVPGDGNGGGLYADTINLTVVRSTFANNVTQGSGAPRSGSGGGIIFLNGTATIANSTFSGNQALGAGPTRTGQGGGLHVVSYALPTTVSLINSTFANNEAENVGGGIALDNDGGPGLEVVFENTIVSSNVVSTGPDENCTIAFGPASLTSRGHNLEDLDTCNFSQPSDQINTDPLLGPLQDNGGATWTHALLDFSPAIDAGDDTTCAADPINGVDQRGVSRPVGPHCDVGAYESAAIPPISGLSAGNDSPTPLGETTTLTATVATGQPVTYTWSFGDGDTGMGASATHVYPAVGTYTAVVTVTDTVNTVTATTTVTITEPNFPVYLPVIMKP